MEKIGLLIISKNNYELLDVWFKNYDYSNFEILNIDDGSSIEQNLIGKQKCFNHDIDFLESDKPGVQNNIKQAINFFEKKKISWIIYQHHDSYPLTENLYGKLQKYLNNPLIYQFGVIGFNVFCSTNNDLDYCKKSSSLPLRTTARSPLELGDGWYRVRKGSRINYAEVNKPFAVESVMWTVALINSSSFLKHIEIDDNYQFFHAWDDIAFQFLNKNIYNIVLPDIHFIHDQQIKEKFSIPKNSSTANIKKRQYFWGRFDHLSVWEKKWKFKYDVNKKKYFFLKKNFLLIYKIINKFCKLIYGKDIYELDNLETVARETFKKNENEFKGTLIVDFFNHDPKKGPLKTFEL